MSYRWVHVIYIFPIGDYENRELSDADIFALTANLKDEEASKRASRLVYHKQCSYSWPDSDCVVLDVGTGSHSYPP